MGMVEDSYEKEESEERRARERDESRSPTGEASVVRPRTRDSKTRPDLPPSKHGGEWGSFLFEAVGCVELKRTPSSEERMNDERG